jgi:hypothetical protein
LLVVFTSPLRKLVCMPNPDPLNARLGAILTQCDDSLDAYLDKELTRILPEAFAGGVHLSQILDLPQAATPDAFKLGPPTDAELAALEQVYQSMAGAQVPPDIQLDTVTDSDEFSLFSSPSDLHLTDVPESSVSLAPSTPAPRYPNTTFVTEGYVPFRNTASLGRNSLPCGCYLMAPRSVLIEVDPFMGTHRPKHFRLGSASAAASDRLVVVFSRLNSLPVCDDVPDDSPYFYCLVFDSERKTPLIARALVSDIEHVMGTTDAQMTSVFVESTRSVYEDVVAATEHTDPTPLLLDITPSSLVPPSIIPDVCSAPMTPMGSTDAVIMLPMLQHLIAGSTVNDEDKALVFGTIKELMALDRLRHKYLSTLASLFAKHVRN